MAGGGLLVLERDTGGGVVFVVHRTVGGRNDAEGGAAVDLVEEHVVGPVALREPGHGEAYPEVTLTQKIRELKADTKAPTSRHGREDHALVEGGCAGEVDPRH